MRTHTRHTKELEDGLHNEYHGRSELDTLSDEELELLLFEEEKKPESSGLYNLSLLAGGSMIVVGIVHLLLRLQGNGLDTLVALLPWFAAVLIALTVLSPSRENRKKEKRHARIANKLEKARAADQKALARSRRQISHKTKRLRKSKKRKLAGVCGGFGEYFGMDPVWMRTLFVLSVLIPPYIIPFIAYFVCAFIMPAPEKETELPSPSHSGPSEDNSDLGYRSFTKDI